MLELNQKNFKEEISKGTIIVDSWAEWCGPCKAATPIFAELSKEMKNVKFAKLNVDENQEIASRLSILGIPTFIVFKNGKEIGRITGLNSKAAFKVKIEEILKK